MFYVLLLWIPNYYSFSWIAQDAAVWIDAIFKKRSKSLGFLNDFFKRPPILNFTFSGTNSVGKWSVHRIWLNLLCWVSIDFRSTSSSVVVGYGISISYTMEIEKPSLSLGHSKKSWNGFSLGERGWSSTNFVSVWIFRIHVFLSWS